MDYLVQALDFLSSDPLSSSICSLYTLLFLYFPNFVLSPVLPTTLILVLYLLRLGASQNPTNEADSDSDSDSKLLYANDSTHRIINPDGNLMETKPCPAAYSESSFVEWDVRAPLEVIYEEYCEEDGEHSDEDVIQKYASLSLFFPESDGESSSEGDFSMMDGDCSSPESGGIRWEEEEDREGLIEIELDAKNGGGEVEEENLIEIELFPA